MNKQKLIGTILGIVLFIAVIAGLTYAYISWTSEDMNKVVSSKCFNVFYDKGTDFSGAIIPSTDYTGGISVTVKMDISSVCDINAKGKIYLTTNATTSSNLYDEGVLNYQVLINGSVTDLKGTITSSGDTAIDVGFLNHNDMATTTYTIYVWINGEYVTNEHATSTYSGSVRSEAIQTTEEPPKETLVNHINNLYYTAQKSPVPNNGITYNYASSVSLMNDRLGNSNINIDSGNIRYYGSSPDNYVDIGDVYEKDTVVNHYEENAWVLNTLGITSQDMCLSYANCPTLIAMNYFPDDASCQAGLTTMFGTTEASGICGTETIPAGTTKSLYRIIGLFKDVELSDGTRKNLVKVMRNDTIGYYSWDQSPADINNGYGVNEWSQADLMKLLNPNYENETVGGSLYWNSGSGSCYGYDYVNEVYTSIPCNFKNKGLSTNAKNNIEEVKWNLGGWNNSSIFANEMYSKERGNTIYQVGSNSNYNDTVTRTTIWPGRVALAYPSDYGYAADLNSCTSNFYNYENCTSSNWMYPRMTFGGFIWSWLLTPNSSFASGAWYVSSGGLVGYGNGVVNGGGVSPVFYLDSELTIESGSGKSDDPYKLW